MQGRKLCSAQCCCVCWLPQHKLLVHVPPWLLDSGVAEVPQAAISYERGTCATLKAVTSQGYLFAGRVALVQQHAGCMCVASALLFLND